MPSVLDAASLGAIPLLDAARDCGSAFVLDSGAAQDAMVDAGEGWVVEVRKGSPIVVARGGEATSFLDAHAQGVSAAQRGLDVLAIRGWGDRLIKRADDDNLAWWVEDERRVIHATSVAPLRLHISATAVVTTAEGVVKPQPPEPPVKWHPSFRYFRLAQVSEEVFDAYRNLYLALESVLSDAWAPAAGEREGDWLRRALGAAGAAGVNLSAHAPPGAQDAVAAIRQHLYSDTRTATFHAKAGARTLLPLDPVDRGAVLEQLSRLAALYLDLVNVTLGVRRLSGAMFAAGFGLTIGRTIAELAVHITDDQVRVTRRIRR